LLTSHAFSRAIALNAQGRAHSLSWPDGSEHIDLQAAVGLFTRASVILPDCADSYLNLAELYVRWGGKADPGWSSYAERLLQQAIRVCGTPSAAGDPA
jgi:hypothetical protein